MHAAVYAAGVAPGDEVITSPYTMSATSTVILMCGATPIFADIEDETFGIDPVSVEGLITPRTKAILVVNIFGHAARLTELKEIAEKHGLYLIEDNSQALVRCIANGTPERLVIWAYSVLTGIRSCSLVKVVLF